MKHMFLMVLITTLLALSISGCVTTKNPDGSSSTHIDQAAAIALTQLALQSAEQGLSAYLAWCEKEHILQDQADITRREAQIKALQDTLAMLLKK